jgi:hypothetical protein
MYKCHETFLSTSVSAAVSNVGFLENERLRGNAIKSLYVRRSGGIVKKDKSGKTLVSDGVLFSAHLSLVDNSAKPLVEVPLEIFVRDYNAPEPICVDWSKVDPTQSRIIFDVTAAGYDPTHVFEFVFEIPTSTNC